MDRNYFFNLVEVNWIIKIRRLDSFNLVQSKYELSELENWTMQI